MFYSHNSCTFVFFHCYLFSYIKHYAKVQLKWLQNGFNNVYSIDTCSGQLHVSYLNCWAHSAIAVWAPAVTLRVRAKSACKQILKWFTQPLCLRGSLKMSTFENVDTLKSRHLHNHYKTWSTQFRAYLNKRTNYLSMGELHYKPHKTYLLCIEIAQNKNCESH